LADHTGIQVDKWLSMETCSTTCIYKTVTIDQSFLSASILALVKVYRNKVNKTDRHFINEFQWKWYETCQNKTAC